MTEKTAAVVKDKVPDVPQKTEPADHIVQSQNGQEALKILKGADKAKTTENLNPVDIVEKVKVEVKKGDTLSHIVEAHTPKKAGESHGDYVKRLYKTVDEVAKEHGIANPNKIKEGQKLELNSPPRPGENKTENKAQTKAEIAPEIKPELKPENNTGASTDKKPVIVPENKLVQTRSDGAKLAVPDVVPDVLPVVTAVVPEKKPLDVEAMKKQADDLYAVTAGRWGRDAERAKEILRNLDEGQRQVLEQQYKGRHGTTIDAMLRSELGGKDLTEAQTSLHAKDNQVGAERGKAERAAEAIDDAANGGLTGAGTDKKIIEEILKGKSKEELTAIDAAYKARTGLTLKEEMEDEFSGSDLTRMLALTEGKNDDASRITAALEEHKEWGFDARSNGNVEKDLRDTISTLNSQQIAELDKTYRERNNGKSLSEAFQQDENLPQETKDALAIYLKGTDKLTPADTLALADIGLKAKNQDIFQEAFRGASPEARAQFLAQGGEQKVTEAFGKAYGDESGNITYSRNSDVDAAMDYVKKGKLDAATKIADNTSVLGDNEAAIELSLAQMTAAERKSYTDGKALSAATSDTSKLSPVEKDNLDYYNKVRGALDKAGDEREIAKWEDMIASGKDGSLITRLAAHGGMIDDSMDKYLSTIEDMSKSDWEQLKKDPEYRKKLEATLAIDLSDSEMVQARAALDKKMSADTFEGSKEKQRSVVDSIKDKSGFWNDDEKGIIGALEKMTPEEQRRYREDPEFKKQLDQAVTSMDLGAERNAVNSILEKVAKGEKPDSSIVSKLEMHSTAFNIDEAKVIADIEQAFRADPTLRERIKNPQTPADQEMAGKFDTALRKNLTPYEYERFAKPLMENGRIPFEIKADLYKGAFNDDEAGFYDSLKKDRATAQDWKELLDNPDKVMGFLSKEEREVALNIARQQGEMKPEDNLRAAMLGVGTAEEKIKEVLGSMSPEQKQTVRAAYELKYGSSLTGDVLGELGGSDKVEAARNLRENQSARQAYNDARTEVSESADGIGRKVVRAWDGTSQMTQDQLEQYSKSMGEYSKTYQEMPVESRQKFEQDVYKALELYKKSEMAAADTIVDGAIIAAGVGGAAFTGGVSLSLLAATSVGGALFKVGAKSAIMGADYDFNSAQVLSDGATGAIDAATIFLGPAQAAQMLKLGERSAFTAVRGVLSQADNVAVVTGRHLLKEGAEETLEKGLKQQLANAIANGAEGVDAKALHKLAEKVATNVDDVPAVQKLLTENLEQAIKTESAKGLKEALVMGLNTGSGAVGGMLSGGVRGGVDGESIDAVLAQSMSGLASGAAMAGTFTLAFKGLGKGMSHMRQGDGPAPHITADPAVRLPNEVAPTPKLDASGRVAEYSTPMGKVEFDYHKSGTLEGQVRKVSLPNGIEYLSKDGASWTVKDPTASGGKYEVKGTMKVDSDGTMHWQAEGGNKSQLRSDGSRVEVDKVNGREVTASYLGQVERVKDGKNGVEFKYDGDGHVTNAKFDNGTVVERTADGKALLRRADGSQEELSGKLSVASDGRLFVKTEDGSSFRSISADGSSVQVEVKTGRVSEAVTANGQRYQYEYNDKGELIEATLPDGKRVKADKDGGGWVTFDETGREYGMTTGDYKVGQDGSLSFAQSNRKVVHDLDGTDRVYDTTTNKIVFETGSDNVRVHSRDVNPVDGRPVEFQEKVREKFKYMDRDTREQSVSLVSRELGDVRAIGADGQPTSAYDSLMRDPTLTDRQKANILDNLSEIREHFASYRSGDRMHSDPEVNWIHTQGELAKVLEVSRKAGLRGDEMEDALLASMYSDSVKFAFPAPAGAEPNFFTHHLDGALAAHEALTKKGFPPERVDRIVQAIKEHQIAPPEFMGNLYLNAKIKPGLDAQLKSGAITAERHAELAQVLREMTVVGTDNVPRLKPIAQVNDWPKVRNADGSWELKLTPDQKDLLKLSGVERWSTPVNPVETPGFKQLSRIEQEKLVSQYKISTALINGDAIDNYATLGGASKIITIRGPETGFRDLNIFESFKSIDDSYGDAYKVLTPEGKELADISLAQRRALMSQENGIDAKMAQWLKSKEPPIDVKDVVYLQKEGKLRYPDVLMVGELERFNKLLADPGLKAQTPEGALLRRELNSLKYKGMTAEEIRQFDLAKEVRSQMADLMRAGHRVDESLPGKFPKAEAQSELHPEWLKSKQEPLPEATGPVSNTADGSSVTPTKDGAILRTSDGWTQVTDTTNGTARTYDAQGRIVQAVEGPRTRSFEYGEDGKLTVVTMESGDVLRKNSDGEWIGPIKQEDGSVKDDIWYHGEIVADGNGSVRYVDEQWHKNTTEAMDGSRIAVTNGKTEYLKLSLATESSNLGKLVKESFPDVVRRERFDNFVKEFEVEAAKRNMPEQQKANFYRQVNRLLEPNPAAVLSQAERADLAEQLMVHTVRPTTVDQGCNSTCNVTTLEVRNYARDPEKNAQLIADIATDGKFTTSNGTVVDMTALENGLKPDTEAARALRLQQKPGADALKKDGSRDWSSQLVETAMVNSYWQGQPHIIIDGKRVLPYDLAFDKEANLVGHVKKASKVNELYDAKGQQLGKIDFAAGEKAYTKSGKEIKGLTEQQLVYHQNGSLRGMTRDKNTLKVFDSAGKPLTHLEAGTIGYDEAGKQILKVSKPGEIKYEKTVLNGVLNSERVVYKDGDSWLNLRDRGGEVMDAPSIHTDELEGVNGSSTGLSDNGYMLTRGSEGRVLSGMQELGSSKELGDALLELQKQGKLPAVIQVHTAASPFSQMLGIDSALGWGGGWHVVNVHGYDPATGMVKFSNQWGSKHDYMDKGYPIDKLFKSMKEPVLYKFMTTKTGRTIQGVVATGVAGYLYTRDR